MIGKKLKKLRSDKKLTQLDVAKILEMNRASYAKYELNSRQPDYSTLIKLAKFYNVSLDSFFDLDKDIKKSGQTFDQEKVSFKSELHEELFHKINLLNEVQISIVKDIVNSLLKTNQTERKKIYDL